VAVQREVTSRREPSRRVVSDHPPQLMIGELHERVTRHRSRNHCHFAHSVFVASF
jgi:hypothetical protein